MEGKAVDFTGVLDKIVVRAWQTKLKKSGKQGLRSGGVVSQDEGRIDLALSSRDNGVRLLAQAHDLKDKVFLASCWIKYNNGFRVDVSKLPRHTQL